MKYWSESPERWKGRSLEVTILQAVAGIAQQILVKSPRGMILFDAGDGSLRDLLSNGIDPNELDAVFVTHGHFDHMGGLHSLLGFMRMCGRKQPLIVAAPNKCEEVARMISNFETCYPDTTPFDIKLAELKAMQFMEVADVAVTAYPVVHCGSTEGGGILDPIPAMGYRISCDGEQVAISGDTGDCPGLRQLVEGVDLAVIEATFPEDFPLSDEVLHKVHLNETLAHEIGTLAKEYILVHKAKVRER